METITWYSMDGDLELHKRGPVELAAALAVVDDYFAKLKPHYESAEQALAESTFGFTRGDRDFIEICLHTASKSSLTVELPPGSGLIGALKGPFKRRLKLDSCDALKRHVTRYFDSTPDEFKAHLARGG